MNRQRLLWLVPATALLLAACSDDGATGPELAFDPFPFTTLMGEHVATFQTSYGANQFLARQLPTLAPFGVEFEPGGDGGGTPLLRAAPIAQPRVTFPPEVLGATFVYDGAEEAWYIDDSATGAPADGIRLTWYQQDGAGFPIPTAAIGYIDLADQDADGLSRLGVEIVALAGGVADTLSIYTVGYAETEGTAWTEQIEASGWVEDDTRRLQFEVDGGGSGSTDTGDSEFAFLMDVTGPDGSYSLDLVQQYDGGTENAHEEWTIDLWNGMENLRLDLVLDGPETDPEVTGTIRYQGAVVAGISGGAGSLVFTDATGDRYEGNERSKLETLVGTMIETAGYYLLNALPLLYF